MRIGALTRLPRVLPALILAAAARSAAAAPPPTPLADHVPADALAFFSWQGAQNLAPAYAQSNLKGFIGASTLPEFFSTTLPHLIGEKTGSPEAVALAQAQAAAMLLPYWNHPAALYVGPVDFSGGDGTSTRHDFASPIPHIALLCDAGKDAGRLNAALQNILQFANASPDMPFKVSLAANDSLVVLAIGLDANSLLPANPASLAANPAYLRTLAAQADHAPATPAVAGYIDIHASLDNLLAAISKDPDITKDDFAKINAVVDSLGVRPLHQLAFSAGFDGKQWVESSFLEVPAAAPRVGVLRMLDPKPISPADLTAIPKDAATASIANADLDALYNDIRDTLPKIDPKAQQDFDQGLAEARKELGFDLHRDLVATIDGRFITYQTSAPGLPYVLALTLKDPAKFNATLAAIVDKVNAAGGQYAVDIEATPHGRTYTLKLPQITLAAAIHGDSFYLSTEAGLDAALTFADAKAPSLADNPAFVALRKAYPDKVTSLAYTDPVPLYAQVYQAVQMLLPLAKSTAGIDLPTDLLPSPEGTTPFFAPAIAVSWTTPEGIHSAARSAFPGAEFLGSQQGTTAVTAVAATTAIMLPSLARARQNAQRTASASNIHQMGIALNTYAAEYDQKCPDSMADFITVDVVRSPKIFVEPGSSTVPLDEQAAKELAQKDPAALAKQLSAHSDYTYLGKGQRLPALPRDYIVIYEKPLPGATGINVGYSDAHVEFKPLADLETAFATTNAYRKANNLDPVDTDALLHPAATQP